MKISLRKMIWYHDNRMKDALRDKDKRDVDEAIRWRRRREELS